MKIKPKMEKMSSTLREVHKTSKTMKNMSKRMVSTIIIWSILTSNSSLRIRLLSSFSLNNSKNKKSTTSRKALIKSKVTRTNSN